MPAVEYRRKPRTITINGHKVPEPMRVAPEDGSKYWYVNLHLDSGFGDYEWEGDDWDCRLLFLGLCHSTKKAAEAHARALLSFTEVKA